MRGINNVLEERNGKVDVHGLFNQSVVNVILNKLWY